MDGADAAAPVAPPLPEQPPSIYDLLMASLERNVLTGFDLRSTVRNGGRGGDKLTVPQARSLVDALKRSTSVQSFFAILHCCSVQSFHLFIDYIRTSSRLEEVTVEYDNYQASDPKEIVSSYKAHVDQTFHAVLENPSIHKLTVYSTGNNPDGIYNLLANTTALTEFRLRVCDMEEEMAMSIASGFSKNLSLGRVELSALCGPLETMLSGLAVSSSVESLIIPFSGSPTASFWKSVSRTIHFSSSLKDLTIDAYTHCGMGEVVDKVLSDLPHQACTGLKKLHLKYLPVGGEMTILHDAPIEEAANTSLQVLYVEGVLFQSANAVRSLWNMVGLRELYIDSPTTARRGDAENECYLAHWATFIQRNEKMTILDVIMGEADEHCSFLNGVLDGARKHKSLTKLKITGSVDDEPKVVAGNIGTRLSRVLEETQALTELHFEQLEFEQVCATLLAQGLCGSKTVEVVSFKTCEINALSIVEIVESLFVNQTIKDLSFRDVEVGEVLGGAFCKTLGQLFQSNKVLVKFFAPRIDLRAGALTEIFAGLRGNKSLKKFLLDECCLIDNEAMSSLGHALEATDISLQELGLPKDTSGLEDVPNVTEGTRAFLQSLVRMPKIKKVHFGDTIRDLDHEFRGLLLEAAKENKNLIVLDGCAPTMDNASAGKAEIVYNLKLNRFGRRILESTNFPPSFWPPILSQMTRQRDDADALFYFVREYFSRRSGRDDEPNHPQPPPKKKARLSDGE